MTIRTSRSLIMFPMPEGERNPAIWKATMQPKTVRFCFAAAWLLGGGAAYAQPGPAENPVKVAGGQEVQIGVFANTNTTCTGLPAPELRITAPPAKGILAIKLMSIRFGKEGGTCAEKQIFALGLFYRANAGTEGADSARIEVVAGTASQTKSYAITITK